MDRRDFFKISLAGGVSLALVQRPKALAGTSSSFVPSNSKEYFDSTGSFTQQELIELAEKHGAPLYVYDGDLIIKKFQEFRKAFQDNYPKVNIHYAFKANTNLNVLSMLRKQGAAGECISTGEMEMGFEVGYKAEEMMFTSNSKSLSELEFAVKKGVLINLDSIPDLENLIEVCKKLRKQVRVSFRINPDINPHTHKNISTGHKFTKFGILQSEEELLKAYKMAKENSYILPEGVHSHIGSQILEVEPFLENVEIVTSVALKLKEKLGLELKFLNLGGGLGIPYYDNQIGLTPKKLAETVCPVIKEKLKNFKNLPELWLEPGRYFVAQSGILISRVNSVKLTPYKNFINVNTGFNHLARPLLYEAYHRVRILGERINFSKDLQEYEVAGNICETGDILAQQRYLPLPKVGSYLAFLDVGAYGFSMSSEYNSFFLPAEIMKKRGSYYLIRKRETLQDLLRNQITHPELKT